MMSRNKSFRNQYNSSPWIHGIPSIGMGGDGVYGFVDQYTMMSCGYFPNQGGYGDMYSGNGMDQMRSIGYGRFSQAHNYRAGQDGGYGRYKFLDGLNSRRTLQPLSLAKKPGRKAGMKAFQQVDQDSSRKDPRKHGNWCTLCKCSFSGNFLFHRRMKEHRKNRDKKYPKCHPCRVSFRNPEEYKDHCKKEDHKLKSAELQYMKNLPLGSDDEIAVEPVKPKEIEKDDVKLENEKPAKPEESMAVGQRFVICVKGYYCKLCRKFFKDVSVAKGQHCRSIMHYDAFKKGMEEAKEQEKKRQKLFDEEEKLKRKSEQEKLEREAECLTTEITTKQTTLECKDVEMKESTEQNVNFACEKIETSDADINGEMKVTSPEEVKKDRAEAEGNSAFEKMEISGDADMPNGEKEGIKVASEEEVKKDVAEIKEGLPGVENQVDDIRWSFPKIKEHYKEPRVVLQRLVDARATLNLKKTESASSSVLVTIMEENKIVETARSDHQGVEEKLTSSPARRGNRATGRRQSRGRRKRR